MSHSHMPVQHLLRQVEIYRSKRQQGEQADNRPEWMTALIESIADLFEPLADEGRAGYDCRIVDGRWVLEMYLGATEIVGGPEDGQLSYTNFQFDLHGLLDRFDAVDRFRWNAIPGAAEEGGIARSTVMISGRVGENEVRMHVHSIPPADAGPGFRQTLDGEITPA